jgi:3-methyladenine DNA glycosylase Tag
MGHPAKGRFSPLGRRSIIHSATKEAFMAAGVALAANVVEAIDRIVERVHEFKVDAIFTPEYESRLSKTPDFSLNDEYVLRRLVTLIAYSNQANSSRVSALVDSPRFSEIFAEFNVEAVARLSEQQVLSSHWSVLKPIRFRYKVGRMLQCAECVLSIQRTQGSFMGYLKGIGFPSSHESPSDIRAFWAAFDQIRTYFAAVGLPYFKNFTSLCHLLTDLGFECAKPDSAVMKVAGKLGIVPALKQHPERNLRMVVETLQAYAVSRGTRVPVLDLYFLIHGGQSDALAYVGRRYYA